MRHDAPLDIDVEMGNQYEQWGEQNHPDGTSSRPLDIELANEARRQCHEAASSGHLTWKLILTEEVMEAMAETDPARLREELIQVAAVAATWVEAIDRRSDGAS